MDGDVKTSLMFQNVLGKQTLEEVLNVLERNIDIRRVNESDDDDIEKYALSLSIVNFLKCASHPMIMQNHMDNISDI